MMLMNKMMATQCKYIYVAQIATDNQNNKHAEFLEKRISMMSSDYRSL